MDRIKEAVAAKLAAARKLIEDYKAGNTQPAPAPAEPAPVEPAPVEPETPEAN